MEQIRLPLGVESFAELRESGCYYIDKTGFIRELLDDVFKVDLITRPRRFGKTLMMSMLAEFFDIRKDSGLRFEGLNIMEDTRLVGEWMNRWPVLFLTLKDVNGKNYAGAYGLLRQVLSKLCMEHIYLAESEKVTEPDRKSFERLLDRRGDDTDVKCALDTLMRMMAAHYGRQVILLVDEYDVPLAKASDNGYYDDMLDVIRSLLGMVWKTNPSLKFAVVTGCLRVAKESIFTGANNFISNSLSGERYQGSFGFLEHEVVKLLRDTGCEDHYGELKKWYDGYLFGEKEVYCPWDVINHVNLLQKNPKASPASYWKDTSHNNIIRRFMENDRIQINEKMEILLSGGVIRERIVEEMTYDFEHSSEDNLWSVLYLTGYLTRAALEDTPESAASGKTALRIPNEEVKAIFAETVAKWFTDHVGAKDRTGFFQDWWNGNADRLTKEVSDILFDTISYFDYKEDYYHAFVAGLFSGAGYEVSSNSEQGTGRADVVVKDRRRRRAIIIEIKRCASSSGMEEECERALGQIRKRQYAQSLAGKGYETVLCYGAVFCAKKCLIRAAG